MYGWIWRRLPLGTPGKIAGSLLLTLAAAALFWYVIFPAVDPHLPFNDGQVTNQDGPPGADNVAPPSSGAPASPRPGRTR
jgi:hypothetical protein